jgi:transposase
MSYGIDFSIKFLEKKLGKRVAKQILFVILMCFRVERKIIIETLSASQTTLSKYNKALENEDLGSIFEQEYNRPESDLEQHREKIEKDFEENPPANCREAAVRIQEMTGISRHTSNVGKFLKKGG